MQHKDKPGVKIKFTTGPDSLKAAVDARELQRIVSNLVNNSIEAFTGPGTVDISLASADGKGIPPEILSRLGRKGETHGKAGGTGLGLYHARTAITAIPRRPGRPRTCRPCCWTTPRWST